MHKWDDLRILSQRDKTGAAHNASTTKSNYKFKQEKVLHLCLNI